MTPLWRRCRSKVQVRESAQLLKKDPNGFSIVMYIVKTFDWLQSIPIEVEAEEEKGKVKNWALPRLEFRPKAKLSDLSPLPVSCSVEWIAEEGGLTEHSFGEEQGQKKAFLCGDGSPLTLFHKRKA